MVKWLPKLTALLALKEFPWAFIEMYKSFSIYVIKHLKFSLTLKYFDNSLTTAWKCQLPKLIFGYNAQGLIHKKLIPNYKKSINLQFYIFNL